MGTLWLSGIPSVPVFGTLVDLSHAEPALCGLYLAWIVNLFNFMDGINGIARVEAIKTTLGGALLWWLTGGGTGWLVAILFAACVAGFLVWNFPLAKIFMGDAGSGFLGLMVALLSLWCGQTTPALFWVWSILIGCFMVDATTTLMRRVRRGERFFEVLRIRTRYLPDVLVHMRLGGLTNRSWHNVRKQYGISGALQRPTACDPHQVVSRWASYGRAADGF